LNSIGAETHMRRKRSWYRRRLRVRRGILTAAMLLALVAVCWQSVARRWALPTLHTSNLVPDSFSAPGDASRLAFLSQARGVQVARSGRATYPYSVIPGGIRNAVDLHDRAARDYVVRRHFAGFNYERAHLMRAGRGRQVYLSYRLRDRIYWTRKKVRLLEAELLLTDGAITARTRCGNQVSETPQPDVSDEEPAADVLDQPVTEMAALGPAIPIRFPSVHPNLPSADAVPPGGPTLFAGGFSFPYIESMNVVPHLCKPGEEEKDKRCKHHHKPPHVPEPGSWILISSGLLAIFWCYRRRSLQATTAV
jgi:hypothetical protein